MAESVSAHLLSVGTSLTKIEALTTHKPFCGLPRHSYERADIYLAMCTGLFALLVRLMAAATLRLSGDEGVIGLMGLDLLNGLPPTVYWYGQEYMGTLENIIAAPFIAVFGARAISIRMPSVVATGTAVALVYIYFARRGERIAAVTAAMLLALSPTFFSDITSRARGGYGITLPLAAGMVLAAAPQQALSFKRGLLLGLLAGIAFWTNPQTAGISLLLLVWVAFARCSKAGMAGLCLGALAGLAPSLVHMAQTGVFMRLSMTAFQGTRPGALVVLRRAFAVLGIGGPAPLMLKAATAAVNAGFLAVGAGMYIIARAREGGGRELDALGVMPLVAGVMVAASPTAYPQHRYLYLGYFALVLLAACGWQRLGVRAAGAALGALLAVNAVSLALYHRSDPYAEEYFCAREYQQVIEVLESKAINDVVTDYGVDFSLMYLTELDVMALPVPLGGVWTTRYEQALVRVPDAGSFAVVLYVQPEHEKLKNHMRPSVFAEFLLETGRTAEVHTLGRITILHNISGMESASDLTEYGIWAHERYPVLEALVPSVQAAPLYRRR